MFKPFHQRFLKVKIKSLVAESKIIRGEEKKSSNDLRGFLYMHRVGTVRRESRSSHLAYGYMRGKTLSQLEGKAIRYRVIDHRAHQIVKKFGTKDAYEGFTDWLHY